MNPVARAQAAQLAAIIDSIGWKVLGLAALVYIVCGIALCVGMRGR